MYQTEAVINDSFTIILSPLRLALPHKILINNSSAEQARTLC